jgi:TetR/AcrR family transcriptional repressor of nem operon
VDGSCPLIGLPSDAARGGEAVKTAYRQVTESMIRLFEANLSGPEAREQALVFVALCVGGMVLARGIDDRALGDELRKSAERHILAMTGWEDGQLH